MDISSTQESLLHHSQASILETLSLSSSSSSYAKDDPSPLDEGSVLSIQPTKLSRIIAACHEARENQDYTTLIVEATSIDGFLNDRTRQMAWPLLLKRNRAEATSSTTPWQVLPQHRDEDQVKLDVDRSFIYYPTNESQGQLDERKNDLFDVIIEVLRLHPMLCYFQGFHDIVQVLLLVLGKEASVSAVSYLSLLRIRDFMLPTMAPCLAHLHLLPAILHVADEKLGRHLSGTQPFFALTATLTLFAHEIQGYQDIARLFDFLLAHEAVLSIYLFATVILSRRKELLEISVEEPDMLHFALSKLPPSLDLELIIQQTIRLFHAHPAEQLPFRAWHHVSRYSVLKTTRGPDISDHTIADGEALFALQCRQLEREAIRKRLVGAAYRYVRPAGSVGLAIVVGVLSYWLAKGRLESTASKLGALLQHFRGDG